MKKQRNNNSPPIVWTRYLLWLALFLGFFACKEKSLIDPTCNPRDFDTGDWGTMLEASIWLKIFDSRDSDLVVGLWARYLPDEVEVYDEQHKLPHLFYTDLDGVISFKVFDDNHRPIWGERSSRTFYIEFPNNDIDTIFFEYNSNRIQPCPNSQETVSKIDYLSLSYNRKLYINKAKSMKKAIIYKKKL